MSQSWRFHSDLSDELRKVAVDWARSNGLDTDRVPFNAVFTIADGQLSTEYIGLDGAHANYTPVTVPLLVPLPDPFVSAPGAEHAPLPPFRIDVPSVPPHVTCLRDAETQLWVRHPYKSGKWAPWSDDPEVMDGEDWLYLAEVLGRAATPLVECPDPRKATST